MKPQPDIKEQDIIKIIEKAIGAKWLGLRPELILHQGTKDDAGKTTWVLEDPVQGNYYEIGTEEAQFILCLISEPDIISAINKLKTKFSVNPSLGDTIKFLKMLTDEKLAYAEQDKNVTGKKNKAKNEPSPFKKIITGYLFIKIPVIKPDNLLTFLLPYVSFLWSKPLLFLYALLSGMGVLSLFQQWELYWHTVNNLFTPKGFLYFFIALSCVKTLHEFGHTFAAKANGIFVRRMGLALMVFMPILYCDISDAWRHNSRKKRLLIASAGILTEIAIAGIALFIWSISSDGIIRSIMFYVSGASVISSIFTNMNPLMRFDAYYLLMDYLKINNLRTRSLKLYKYSIRKILVDWQAPIPEVHPKHKMLVSFGLLSWLYRIFIFAGITFIIYHFVFKALGVLLVLIQILLLILLPFIMEVRFLIANKKYWGKQKRLITSAAIFAFILYMIIFPTPRSEKLPAFFMFEKVVKATSPESGELLTDMPEIKSSASKDEILLKIKNRDLEQEKKIAEYNLKQLEKSIESLSGGGIEGGHRNAMLSEKKHFEASLKTAEKAAAKLNISSPISGFLADINDTLQKGSYIAKDTYLFTIADTSSYEIVAYANEKIYPSLKNESDLKGKTVFKNMEIASFTVSLKSIRNFPAESFPEGAQFYIPKGRIGSMMASAGELEKQKVYYSIIFKPDKKTDITSVKHGTECELIIKSRKSAALNFLRWAFKGLAKEGLIFF